jgi:hypothetical protein
MAQPTAKAQVIATKATIAPINTRSIHTLIQVGFSKKKVIGNGLKIL